MEDSHKVQNSNLKIKNLSHHLIKFINSKDYINLVATNCVCDLVVSIDFLKLGPFEIKWVVIACVMFVQQPTHNNKIHTLEL
jgi:hypothetical protein